MANNNKVDQKEREEQLKRREDLEALIKSTTGEIQAATSILPKRTDAFLDYHTVKDAIDIESKEIVISIAEFYLDSEIIEKVPYVLQKTKVDRITVSSLLFQMKTAEHAIIKLLGEIDDGNLHPRTFEVLASLQRSKMEIVKHLAQFMIIMENAYKNFKEDYRLKKSETVDFDADDDENAGFRTRGSKALIQAMQKMKDDEAGLTNDIEEATDENEEDLDGNKE